MFDESLNFNLQPKQLDVLVRFWNGDQICSRYYTSHFLGHADADTILSKLMDTCTDLGLSGILQLSMDGPNVNWSVFDKLSKEVEVEAGHRLLNVGSCGLHVLHNAFKLGCSKAGWDIEHAMCCLHWLFHDDPARREDYVELSGSSTFPLKFCGHRWLENVPVAERLLDI
eukprot:scpid49772/ scgid29541/ 